MNTQKHKTDLDPRTLKDANFDTNYVQSVRIRTLRNIRGFCLPPFCTRGERRDIESIVVKSLYKLDTEYQGTYYALKDLSTEEETTLMNVFFDHFYLLFIYIQLKLEFLFSII